MSSVLNKKLRRDIIYTKGMLIAVVAIIAAGISFFVGMAGTYKNLDNAKIDYYSRCRMADFWIDLKKAPNSAVNELMSIKGVSQIRKRIVFPVVVDMENVNKPLSGTAISMPPDRIPVINNIVMKRGSYFSGNNENEVIVSEKFAQARNIFPGTYISLIMNGIKKKLYVVGTAISSEYLYLTPPGSVFPEPASFGAFWIKQKLAEDIFGFSGASNNVVGLIAPEAQKYPQLIINRIDHILRPYGVINDTILKDQSSNLVLNAELKGIEIMALLLPLLFLGSAALILNIVMLRTAEQQRVIIGTLKALGIFNKTIFLLFMRYSLLIGITGGILGCMAGYWLAGTMTNMYEFFFSFPHLTNSVYPSTILIAILVAVIFSVLGSIRGVKTIVNLNPAESMRPPPPQTGKKIFLEKWPLLWSKLNFKNQIILRNIFRNRLRSTISLFCAVIAAALVFMALGVASSVGYMIVFQFDKVLHSDYIINLRNEVNPGALHEAKRLPGTIAAEPQLAVPCNFTNGSYHKKGAITGLVPDSKLVTPCNAAGIPVKIPPTGLLMAQRLADILHVKKGDFVEFTPTKGLKKTVKVPVSNTINSIFGLSVYADYKYLNKLISEESAISTIQLKAQQAPQEKLDFLRKVKKYPQLSSLDIIEQQKQQMTEDFIAKLKSMTYVMIMFAAVIFFGSILNSALISISDRKQEIATLRVMGYQSREVGSLFLGEILVINFLGGIIGLPVGYALTFGIARMFRNNMYSMPCHIGFSTYIWTLILTLVFIFLSYLIIQKTINKLRWNEILNMKE